MRPMGTIGPERGPHLGAMGGMKSVRRVTGDLSSFIPTGDGAGSGHQMLTMLELFHRCDPFRYRRGVFVRLRLGDGWFCSKDCRWVSFTGEEYAENGEQELEFTESGRMSWEARNTLANLCGIHKSGCVIFLERV